MKASFCDGNHMSSRGSLSAVTTAESLWIIFMTMKITHDDFFSSLLSVSYFILHYNSLFIFLRPLFCPSNPSSLYWFRSVELPNSHMIQDIYSTFEKSLSMPSIFHTHTHTKNNLSEWVVWKNPKHFLSSQFLIHTIHTIQIPKYLQNLGQWGSYSSSFKNSFYAHKSRIFQINVYILPC